MELKPATNYTISVDSDMLAGLLEYAENKGWTRTQLFEAMLTHFKEWYNSNSRHENWRPEALPSADGELNVSYPEGDYFAWVKQELEATYLVTHHAILYNIVRRFARDYLTGQSQKSNTVATIIVMIPREHEEIIRLMKALRVFSRYNELYENAANYWIEMRDTLGIERRQKEREGLETEGYKYVEPVAPSVLRDLGRQDDFARRAMSFSRSTYNKLVAYSTLDSVDIKTVGLNLLLDYMAHLKEEGKLDLVYQVYESSKKD